MLRHTRHRLSNSMLAVAALAGGLVLTHHFSGSGASGSFSTTASGSSATPTAAPTVSNAKPDKTVTSAAVPYVFGVVQDRKSVV